MKKRIIKIISVIMIAIMASAGVFAYANDTVYGHVAAQGVNLRSEPNTEANIIQALTLGAEVEILAHEGGWYRVLSSENEVGYIRQDYLFVTSNGSRGAYVLDDNAALRGGPSQSSYIVLNLSAGQGIKVKAMVGEWYYAVVAEKTGYVHRTYVTMVNSSTASANMLKMGMEGSQVRKLQTNLYDRGFLEKEGVTGIFGAKTRAAVLDYQKACSLSADGIAGTDTLESIYDPNNNLKKETATFTQLKGSVVLLNWFNGGSDWLNKGAKFTITDVKTGLSFRARRFGGWYHADSEPITAGDTAIMKRIAGGSWSWNRRAIWVTYNGKTVAASMHCMPHMVNPTQSNNFDGHFCVHLLGSKVHATSRECPRHQACVMEAYNAGK